MASTLDVLWYVVEMPGECFITANNKTHTHICIYIYIYIRRKHESFYLPVAVTTVTSDSMFLTRCVAL
jgi:hypothetical protein